MSGSKTPSSPPKQNKTPLTNDDPPSPISKSPFSELYFENSLGEILPKYSNFPIRLTEKQIKLLSTDLALDPSNKPKQTIIKEILFKIFLSEDYGNRYGHFNSDFETQSYLKQEIFRRTTFVKHGNEIRAQLEKEKAETPTIEDLNSERARFEELPQEGCLVAPFEDFDEEGYTSRVLERANIIPPGVSILALPAPSKSPNSEPQKTPNPKPTPNPISPFGPKSWAKEIEEGECSAPANNGKSGHQFFHTAFVGNMVLVLHAGNTNKNAFKALIAAEYSGVKVELVKDFEMGLSNKTPEFLKMNPIGKVPVLETPEGPVFESNAIARYVTRLKDANPLYGSSLIEYARIEQWIDFASFEIDANILRWFIPRIGFAVYLPPVEEAAISALKRGLGALNTHLSSNTYLVGNSVTLADIVMTCNLVLGFRRLMTKSFTSEFPHVERYFWTMINQPNFHKIVGDIQQAESVPPVEPTKKMPQPKEPAKPNAKIETKKEAEKGVKDPVKPKAEVEEEEAPKPKPKNPLDLLPPSTMILDEWKRLYSNTKTNFREVAIKGFWDMYDPEGYSLWFCDYKYNEENMVSFVTLNKVGGFLQRMDLARKYAFGKMLIIGSEPPFKVKGLWLFRGNEIPQFVVDECYDMELYNWTKVDISDEVQKERVNQMIEDQEPFEGEALLDAKCFK